MEFLAEWRRRRGWTQAELARRVGIDSTAVSRYENLRSWPRKKSLERMAAALDISVAQLLTGPRCSYANT